MDAFRHDVRFALRLIRRTPLLSLATILTLALGVGLNAGVFTILSGMLFRARVTSDPASFVRVQPVYSGSGAPRHDGALFTTRDYRALRDRATTFDQLAAWTVVHARLGTEASDALSLLVTCNFFTVYGLDHLERGRTFRPDECEPPAAAVAVVSDEFWRRHLDADPEVLGKPLLLNRQRFTIVGVTPPEFPGRVRGEGIWLPYTNQAALRQGFSVYDDPGAAWLWVEGRLKRGASRDAAEAELNVLVRQQDRLGRDRTTAVELTNGAFIHEPAVRPVAVFVVPLVLGSVALVLLVAAGNVALLLLARAVTRRREIAVRLAIGCSRGRLFRLLLTESVLLSVLGIPASGWIAWQAPAAMRALIPAMPFYPMQPDFVVFSYLTAATVMAGVAAGLTPIVESLRQRLAPALGGHDSLPASGTRLRSTLMAAQIAMCVVLLSGTALIVRVEAALLSADPSLDAAHVLVANYDPPPSAAPGLFASTVSRLAALPGVAAVAYGHGSTGELGGEGTPLSVRGSDAPLRRVAVNMVSASYFAALNRLIVQGRALRQEDGGSIAGAVVSEALARIWFPRGGTIGAVLETPDHTAFEVVGVVRGDVAMAGASFDPLQMYTLAPTDPPAGQLLVRFSGDAKTLAPRVRDVLRDLGPASAAGPTTLAAANAAMAANLMPLVDMAGTLAIVALVLALVGIYGVVAFSVGRRTREIGVRMALGARRADVLRLILSTGMRPIAAGLAAGLVLVVPAAFALSRVFERTPVPVRAADPVPYAAVAIVLAASALAAMIVPARQATAVDPSVSLRSE